MFFLVATVTTGVDADSGELAAFAPALKGEGRDAEEIGNFADSKEIREILEIEFGLDWWGHIGSILVLGKVCVNRYWFDR